MTDRAEQTAFDGAAPAGERADALGRMQSVHMPSVADLMPSDEIRAFVDRIETDLEMQKSINPNVVPFPSKFSKEAQRGMQSVQVDRFQLQINGDWWEKPGSLSFDSLRAMVEQTPVLNAVILTRIRQIQRFCRAAEAGIDQPGFNIVHLERDHTLTGEEQQSIQLLNRFMSNCGWEFNPRRRKGLRRDAFSQFMAKTVRDTLTMDSFGIELEWKRQQNLGIDGFYAVDGATLRLCSEDGYRGDDEIFALQVVEGRVTTAYTFEDLIYEPRNPRSDVRASGYGISETELLVRVVTGFLNAMTYNIKGFDQNAIPKGMLHLTGNYTEADLNSFKRYWNNMVRGIDNRWALPVMVSKDQESKAAFERFGVDYDEMHFSKWMTFLTSVICAIYGMSPSEINFDSFTAGNTSALSGSDTEEKLANSKDSGLRPIMAYYENLFSDFIVNEFSEKFAFRWTGLDPEDGEKKHEIRKLVLTVDEMRAQEGFEKHPDPDVGGAPLNPSLVSIYSQKMQAEQQPQQDFGQPGAPEQPQGEEPPAQPDFGGDAKDEGDFDGTNGEPDFGQQAKKPDPGPEDANDTPLDFGKAFPFEVYSIDE